MTSAPTHLAKAALTGRVKDSRRGRDWRHSSSKPIIDALYLWLDRQQSKVAAVLAEAIRYGLARWNGLT